MNTCDTCAHWRQKDAGGECSSVKLIEGGYRSVYNDPSSLDALVYSYNEGGWFWTGPKFGCVHHAPKGA